MNTLEQFYIQLHSCNKKLIAEQYPGDRDPLFELIYDLKSQYAIIPLHLHFLVSYLQLHYTQAASMTWFVNTPTVLLLIYRT